MSTATVPLIGADEPPPAQVFNPDGGAPCLLICDHAGRRIPRALDGLGLDGETLLRHIAWDIGALDVARHLAERFDAPLVASTYSRLVIDANREPGDPSSIAPVSDGVIIPGNQRLSPAEARRREDACFHPYHREIGRVLARLSGQGRVPAVISLHSFTPEFQSFQRPWHVGVLWNRDRRIAGPLMEALAADPELCVGDNQPYSAAHPAGYSMRAHTESAGLPHVLIEIRQNLIESEQGAARWAARLGDALAGILTEPGLYAARREFAAP